MLPDPVGTDPEINKKSLEAVVAVLSNARRIAKTFSPEKKAVVEAICSEIETLMRELAELQANGQVRREDGACILNSVYNGFAKSIEFLKIIDQQCKLGMLSKAHKYTNTICTMP